MKKQVLCIGGMRSGTTFLYDLFARDSNFLHAPIKEWNYLMDLEENGPYEFPSINSLMQQGLNPGISPRLMEYGVNFLAGSINSYKESGQYYDAFGREFFLEQCAWLKTYLFEDRTFSNYFRLFGCSDRTAVDISPRYIDLNLSTIKSARGGLDNCKIIVMVRNPYSRIRSHLRFNLLHGRHSAFSSAKIHAMVRHFQLTSLWKWGWCFGQDAVFVMFYDEFFGEKHEKCLRSLYDFLGMPHSQSSADLGKKINEAGISTGDERTDLLERVHFEYISQILASGALERFPPWFKKWFISKSDDFSLNDNDELKSTTLDRLVAANAEGGLISRA